MYKNERVIHLGKNKSPTHTLSNTKGQSLAFKENQPPIQSSPNGEQPIIITLHHQNSQERIISFPKTGYSTCESFIGARGQSKSKNVYPIVQMQKPQINCANQSLQNEKLQSLLGKISILERRIKQLHEEKQHNIVKSHQQIQRLIYQNQILRLKLSELEASNNSQLEARANQQAVLSSDPAKGVSAEEEEDSVSIKLHLDKSKKNNTIGECCLELQKENHQMHSQIDQLFNFSIKSGFLSRANLTGNELPSSASQKLRSVFLVMQKQSTKIENGKAQISKLNSQIEEYAKLLQKCCQQSIKTEDNSIQMIRISEKQYKRKCEQLEHRATRLSQQVDQQRSKGGPNTKESTVQVCSKCKDFVKALVKLNQKVYTGAIVNF